MAIVRCSKGHYYDDKKHLQCPYCGVDFSLIPNNSSSSDENSENKTPFLNDESDDKTLLLSEEDDNKTILLTENDDDNTAILTQNDSSEKIISSPVKKRGNVSGWLVCIEGANRGLAFTLFEGKNRIGRSISMDVCIENDFFVAAENHCVIEYDSIKNSFILGPRTDVSVSVNNKSLNKPRKISSGDKIILGDNTYEFVAFCHGWKKW